MKVNFAKTCSGTALAALALTFSSWAMAAVVTCESAQDGRYMELDSTSVLQATCFDSGLVNEPSPFNGAELLWKIEFDPADTEGPGPNPFLSFTGGNGTSGSLTLIAGLTNHYLVFKFGNGGGDPDWFAFNINGMTAATWQFLANVGSSTNGLSHVSVYGPPGVTVPEPATLALLGLGLAGLGFASRRRRKA